MVPELIGTIQQNMLPLDRFRISEQMNLPMLVTDRTLREIGACRYRGR
jgi:hypothetical protein